MLTLHIAVTDSAKSLRGHLEETGNVDHRSTQDNFGFLTQQSFIALCSIFKTLAVCMFLTAYGYVFKDFSVKHFHFLITNHKII